MQKLSQEKQNKLERLQHLQQKIKAKERPSMKSKGGKSGSTSGKQTDPPKGKARKQTLINEVHTSSVSTSSTALKLKQKHPKQQETAHDTRTPVRGLAEAKALEQKPNKQGINRPSSVNREKPLQEADKSYSKDLQLSIHAYMEACVFAGNIERAHRYLLIQQQVRSSRKRFNADTCNILMRVWAKKVS